MSVLSLCSGWSAPRKAIYTSALKFLVLYIVAVVLVSNVNADDDNQDSAGSGEKPSGLPFGDAILLSVQSIAGEELAKSPGDNSTNPLMEMKAASSLSTNAGESSKRLNSTYNQFSADDHANSFTAWSNDSPGTDEENGRVSSQGATQVANISSQTGSTGFENNNYTDTWGIVADDDSQSFGKNLTALDQIYSHNIDNRSTNEVKTWNSDVNGNISSGDSESLKNSSTTSYIDDKSDRKQSIVRNRYADGAKFLQESISDKNLTVNMDADQIREELKQNWANAAADGSSNVGVAQAIMESNNTAGLEKNMDNIKQNWDLLEADGSVTVGNHSEATESNHTTNQAGLNKNTSQDLSTYSVDGAISLVKEMSQKLESKDTSSANNAGSNNGVWLTEKADGTVKKGMSSGNVTSSTTQNTGSLNENSASTWTNFTSGGKGSVGQAPSADSVVPIGHGGKYAVSKDVKGPPIQTGPIPMPTAKPRSEFANKPTMPPKPTRPTFRSGK